MRTPASTAAPSRVATPVLSPQEEMTYRQQQGGARAIQERRQSRRSQAAVEMEEFGRQLEYWKRRCAWCQAYRGEAESEGHCWLECKTEEDGHAAAVASYDVWRVRLGKPARFAGCHDY